MSSAAIRVASQTDVADNGGTARTWASVATRAGLSEVCEAARVGASATAFVVFALSSFAATTMLAPSLALGAGGCVASTTGCVTSTARCFTSTARCVTSLAAGADVSGTVSPARAGACTVADALVNGVAGVAGAVAAVVAVLSAAAATAIGVAATAVGVAALHGSFAVRCIWVCECVWLSGAYDWPLLPSPLSDALVWSALSLSGDAGACVKTLFGQ
eukprot:5574239-Pleurochrysis_carterae.AAC.2